LRDEHPAWGGRKLRAVLLRRNGSAPSASTITEILRRHGRLDAAEGAKHRAFVRFERAAPNELWQMDFKGHFAVDDGRRCHPLTVLDDHSRFNVGLRACGDQRGETVRGELTEMFRRYGLPRQMLMDNGSPWGCEAEHGETPLTVWLLRLGVRVTHGRAYHPQTQGKEERFHRTLKIELLKRGDFRDLAACQLRFDPWRDVYNFERPHEALDLAVPASCYRASERSFPERLPPVEYATGVSVRKVQAEGWFSFRGRSFRIAKAFRGERLGLRPTTIDDRWDVLFGTVVLGVVDLTSDDNHVRRPDDDRAAVGSVSVRSAHSDETDGHATTS
jgi:transposase InsO family protein